MSGMNSYLSLCNDYLDILYHDSHDVQAINTADLAETPGEILFPGISKLLSLIQMKQDDVFVDLGSGMGKVVIQVFLLSVVREALGIEIVPGFHARAVQTAERVRRELPDFFQQERKLTFIPGNFLEIPLRGATVVLINSVCFGPELVHDIGGLIEHTPSIHTVMSLRPLPGLRRLPFRRAARVECSWDSSLCYIYSA